MSRADLDERAAQLRAAGEPFVRARVVLAHRPTSAKPGDEAIVRADGSIEGFVGGTCAESTVRVQSLRLLGAPTPLLLRIRPDADPGGPADHDDHDDGTLTVHNPCLSGGALEIFLDPVVPPPLVLVHGDGPVAAAIAAVATAAGYRCGAADSVDAADAVVVASHGRDEIDVLCAALDAAVPYIALVASRRRGSAVLAEIIAARTDLGEAVSRIDTPAGRDLGGRTAGEVAVSILAAVIRTRAATTNPRRPPPARINYAGADQLPPNVNGGTEVNDFVRAGMHTAGGDNRADEVAPDVNGGTEVDDFGRAGVDDPRGRLGAGSGVRTAVDPVCGMTVAAVASSLRAGHAGRTVWFCGPGCRRAFESDPARYPES
jgi:xanthine dehydrogenase accessory factor